MVEEKTSNSVFIYKKGRAQASWSVLVRNTEPYLPERLIVKLLNFKVLYINPIHFLIIMDWMYEAWVFYSAN